MLIKWNMTFWVSNIINIHLLKFNYRVNFLWKKFCIIQLFYKKTVIHQIQFIVWESFKEARRCKGIWKWPKLVLSLIFNSVAFVCLFVCFLTFWQGRCSRIILFISCPRRRIIRSSKEPWFLSLENPLRNPRILTLDVFVVLGVMTFLPSWLSEQGNVCVYTDPYRQGDL